MSSSGRDRCHDSSRSGSRRSHKLPGTGLLLDPVSTLTSLTLTSLLTSPAVNELVTATLTSDNIVVDMTNNDRDAVEHSTCGDGQYSVRDNTTCRHCNTTLTCSCRRHYTGTATAGGTIVDRLPSARPNPCRSVTTPVNSSTVTGMGVLTNTTTRSRSRANSVPRLRCHSSMAMGTESMSMRNRLQHNYAENQSYRYCGESFCECRHQGSDVECACGEDDTAFDWIWETNHKASASELSEDKRDVRFHVSCSSGTAAVRGTQPMTDGQYFWEVKMTTSVYGTDMMVGVGTENVMLDAFRDAFCSQLGRDADSWGLSYYGRVQHRGRFKRMAGESRFGQGSIIGVHLDMWHGTLSFYKNRRLLGVAYRGLSGKQLYPMVSSTAARSGMRIIKSCSFRTSLQFFCCQMLRRIVPGHLDVIAILSLPPGLRAFLENNLGWLLRPCQRSALKRSAAEAGGEAEAAAAEAAAAAGAPPKRRHPDPAGCDVSDESPT